MKYKYSKSNKQIYPWYIRFALRFVKIQSKIQKHPWELWDERVVFKILFGKEYELNRFPDLPIHPMCRCNFPYEYPYYT